MPFDGLTTTRPSLRDVTARLGITPIPNDLLEAHKAAEVAKHPSSWWYKHFRFGTFLVLSSLMIGLASTAASVALTITGDGNSGTLLMTAVSVVYLIVLGRLGFLTGELPVYGPAVWKENARVSFYRFDHIPDEIKEMAHQIMSVVPGSYAVVGELKQDFKTLDPYLVVRRPCGMDATEQVVLGIWDDNGVIHQATVR